MDKNKTIDTYSEGNLVRSQMEMDILVELRNPGFLGMIYAMSEKDYEDMEKALKTLKRVLGN